MERNKRPDIITFKVDESLAQAMKGVPNRSEFIRQAILAALESSCPLCGGTGVLTPNQKRHWDAFVAHHELSRCGKCNEIRITCMLDGETDQPGEH